MCPNDIPPQSELKWGGTQLNLPRNRQRQDKLSALGASKLITQRQRVLDAGATRDPIHSDEKLLKLETSSDLFTPLLNSACASKNLPVACHTSGGLGSRPRFGTGGAYWVVIRMQ